MTRSLRPDTRFVFAGSWEDCASLASRARLGLDDWAHIQPVDAGPAVRVYELREDVGFLSERLAAGRRAGSQ
ncbi:hypothetical protein E3T54_11870 [Cryobacterium sp. Sr8]|uniref:hypothetical protein n=1 Tax=Cryobacterium sp. Sr8 TaxID=1259203 RepID=UPI00106CE2CC|nr:hypothetical protein [Cryobacterium sp. Sr8]TFD75423.1 hypothetical protein E3T54_11870 [Cryobacterium sp. Sr8]